ncbi:ATP cone domain-containing protein [Candidatus Nitrosotenuis uzonensis]|uniref:Restriction endonuclease n=1 Tax=Candidatus Nitrosotenuis uzonensis TaxID=1407055 RepID=A0A812EZ35_9ARCH|nr:ATP cone domain-containing protein [Candidatus Nitrosotenuis uzonensis]CAE6487628.1 Restriction endonuclease [Candidatus Nitrosotenuis uzonensis]
MKEIIITKANGENVRFDPGKVESTCMKAGASRKVAKNIASQVISKLYGGMPTKEIYRIVLKLLSENAGIAVKQRYRLKESIMRLGPAGFSFENFVGKVLENYGYKVTATRAGVPGRCIAHEVDLILESIQDGKRWLVECKYHNLAGRYTGLKESLYTHARFLDLSETFDREMLVCNTKVSDEVTIYANCINQKILSWRYPPQNGLEKLVESKKLYPVTILGISRHELDLLSQQNLMIAKDLLDVDISDFVKKTGISAKRILTLQKLVNRIIV